MAEFFKFLLIWCLVAFSANANRCSDNSEFECSDGTCVNKELVCDLKPDCPDHSDEKICEYKMCEKPHWFLCADNHTCIKNEFVCDGTENCPMGDDEKKCAESGKPIVHATCNKFEFTCSDKTCIPLDLICDGKQDCADNSDETLGCIGIETRCKGYLCKNKRCLASKQWMCDNFDDCGDNSDEIGCLTNCKLQDNRFLCKNNKTCILLENVCDGRKDCNDGSDESTLCKTSSSACTNKNCPHRCTMLPTGPECVCEKGFVFDQEKNLCVDVDECQIYGICSQGCINTNGSYNCTCADKFSLRKDGRTCQVQGGEPLLLYTTQKTVVGIYLQSRHLYHVAKNLSQVIGVAYDGYSVYWTDIQQQSESIVRAREDGSHQEVLLTSGLETPEDLAVDWLTKNIYFSDNLQKHIAVCTNNGYYCTVLIVHNMDQPRGIALYPTKGVLFWTDWGQLPIVGKASMDGKDVEAFVSKDVHWPNGLSLDIPNQRLYWVDAKIGTIESVRLDGTDRKIVLGDIAKHPYSIAVFEDQIYWSDWETKSIHVCDKFTGKHHSIVAKDSMVYDVHIYHSALQKKTNHACLNHKCSHMCLLSSNNTFTCRCPDGMTLGVDQLTCKQTVKKQSLFVGWGNYLVQMKHTSFGRHLTAQGIQLPMYIHKMAFNSIQGTLFIADNNQHIIYEIDPKTKSIKVLVKSDLGNVSALAFDHLANNLYWSDSSRHTVEVISLKRKVRAIVHHFSGADTPIAMTVIPKTGRMFIVLKSIGNTHIDMQSLHGRGFHSHLFEEQLGTKGIEMKVDPESETIFWLDQEGNKIEFTNYEGTFRHLFRIKLRHPVSMTVIDDDVAWSVFGSRNIYWTHRSNLGSVKKFKIDSPPFGIVPDEMLLLSTRPLYSVDHKCQTDNGGCSHICVSLGSFSSGCLCPPGLVFKDAKNISCIEALDCEFRCKSGECLTASRKCNGYKDCIDGSDEKDCGAGLHQQLPKMCNFDEFTCRDGTQCIHSRFRCDHNINCKDKSDEEDCNNFDHKTKCHKYQHACANGRCVDLTTLCDGFNDCGDGSDENICEEFAPVSSNLCGEKMFRCANGQCVAKHWECDGRLDCSDGSDEHDKCVEHKCGEGFFECKLGHCIDKQLVCDGNFDCGDDSDELNCSNKDAIVECEDMEDKTGNPKKFQCSSKPTLCLDIAVKCNGTAECPRGEDEVDCTSCSINEFQCKSSKECIHKEFRCDSQKDCNDGSDEIDCKKYNATLHNIFATDCTDNMFQCKDGTCIDYLRVCDGHKDCETAADETEICKTACQNHPCHQKCTPTPHGPICSCNDGYKLGSDKKTCKDINECREFDPCSQICENIIGSYRCSCYPGFMLRADKVKCKSIASDRYMLFSTFNQIRKLSDHPNTLQILWSTNETRINGFDVNIQQQKAYIAVKEEESIFEFDLRNGRTRQISDIGRPSKLSVDWITNNIYFIDHSETSSINVCYFASKSACAQIVKFKPKDKVKSLAVDGTNRYLFYSVMHFWAYGRPQTIIYKNSMDGSQPNVLIKKALYVTALECDTYKKILYYTDRTTNTLQAVSYEGGDPKILVKNKNIIINPSGLSIFENTAFIVNIGVGVAAKCSIYGEKICKTINLNVYNVADVVIVGATRQKNVTNVCEASKCSFLCVQADLAPKCICHMGEHTQPGVECAETNTKGVGNRDAIVHSKSTEDSESSSGIILGVCLGTMGLILAGLLVYISYRKRYGHGKFNISMHFHNPLNRATPNAGHPGRIDQSEVKMCRTLPTLESGTKQNRREIGLESFSAFFKTKAPKNKSDDTDNESATDVGNFDDDPRSRLVL